MYTLQALEIGYGHQSLCNVGDTTVDAGEFICLLGRNGQGKSTLLRTLAGFLPPVAGGVMLDGRSLRDWTPIERARRVGVVLTEKPQLGALRVSELVEMGRQPHTGWSGVLSADDRQIAAAMLERVEGGHLRDRLVDSLSDGERQRVMIARALAQEPRVLLLDEITAFLDLPSRVTIVSTLRRIARQTGVSVILSSHDLELSLNSADRLWLMPGQGKFVDGAPEDVALSGAIGAAFDQPNLSFSLQRGRFETRSAAARTASVKAAGVEEFWIARALERVGFAVTDSAAADTVVERTGDGYVLDGVVHPTLQELARAVRFSAQQT